ncbi:nickel/cobalt transporter [Tropicimonas sp. S265A]|uniref:nickel/cobalt transporter n=1 Tax=Tropicimonas sp. S265A TaxID=3415134 RepID=UPI003C7AA5B8
MRALSVVFVLAFVAVGAWLWTGGWDGLLYWAQSVQREVQGALARGLRALRAGEPGALTTLLVACFTYGFAHAVGPGHGKLVIGGYGLARRVSPLRLSVVAFLSSLAQAATAVLLVYVGVWVLQASARTMSAAADDWLAPASYAAVCLLGLWLVWRGARAMWTGRAAAVHHETPHTDHHARHGHDHAHDHATHADDAACPTCGHAHAPAPEDVAKARSLRELATLIAVVAIRPCTGAIFVLILGWRLDLQAAALAGVVAMALGTGSVTAVVAFASTGLRDSAVSAAGGWTRVARAVPVIELTVGMLIATLAFGLMQSAL